MSSWILLFMLLAMVEAKRLVETIGSNAREQEARQMVSYTLEPTGAECYFDESLYDCAVCAYGGCQCGPENRNLCVECGLESACNHVVAIVECGHESGCILLDTMIIDAPVPTKDDSKMVDTSAGFVFSMIIPGMFGSVIFAYFLDLF